MSGFSTARQKMVDCQVRPSDVTDIRIIDAMLALPREAFVPQNQRELAYLDLDLDVSEGGSERRYMIKPVVTAKMLQAAVTVPAMLDAVRRSNLIDSPPAVNQAFSAATVTAMRALQAFPRPVVALIHGGCFGGGIGLVTASDIDPVAIESAPVIDGGAGGVTMELGERALSSA